MISKRNALAAYVAASVIAASATGASFDRDAEAPCHRSRRQQRKQRQKETDAAVRLANAEEKRRRKAAKRLRDTPTGGPRP